MFRWFHYTVNAMGVIGFVLGTNIKATWFNTNYLKYCIKINNVFFNGHLTSISANKIIKKYV